MCPRSSDNVPSLAHASAPQECPSLQPPAQIHTKCYLACVSKLVSELLIPFFAVCALCIPLYTIGLKDFLPGMSSAYRAHGVLLGSGESVKG